MPDQLNNMPGNGESNPNFDLENELLILKLKAEFGSDTYFPEEDIFPPELKNEWLQSVYEFESAYNRGDISEITVYEKIGFPHFLPEHVLTDEGISLELYRLRNEMLEHQIILENEFDTSDRDIYRFITTEFFEKLTEDINLKGFFKHFLYEDFHPNIPEFLKKYAGRIIEKILKEDLEFLLSDLKDNFKTRSGLIPACEVVSRIADFLSNFKSVKNVEVEKFTVDLKQNEAMVNFHIRYSVEIRDNEELVMEGPGSIGFSHLMYDIWLADSLSIPGLVI